MLFLFWFIKAVMKFVTTIEYIVNRAERDAFINTKNQFLIFCIYLNDFNLPCK